MTPKEKAIELFKKFYCMPNNSKSRIKNIEFDTAKKCALITLDEIFSNNTNQSKHDYWCEVKEELDKL